ncbi:hypothetical protein EVAR_12751_1 [Eumeta japonica]|uniref:Peptidase aspartic putative domain-containing protein n=1 Tax=Eumeta variegata TaxID=151549 RepID=A0A4C1SKN8_EUMVA|nr:hypothetical protein EVAR_12751_1 [Eumeta japonica]
MQEHYLKDCATFTALPIDERWERAKKARMFPMSSNTHYRSECRARPCDNTGRNIGTARSTRNLCASTGSTTTLIERDVALKIAPPGKHETLRIEGVGGKRLDYDESFRLKVKIKGKFERNIESMNALVIDKLQLAPQTIDLDTVRQYSHLHELEDELSYEKARPTILIGQDNWHLIVSREVVQKNRDQPAASYTKLGWVLHGRENGIARPHVINYIAREPSAEDEIGKLIKENFSIECLGIEAKKPSNDLEQRALKVLDDTSRRLPDGRFEIGLIWKTDNEIMPDNKRYAENDYEKIKTAARRISGGESRVAPQTRIDTTFRTTGRRNGCRLAASVKREMNSRITNTTYWTDSKTVLSWINADPRSFKPFVAHRLAEIEETSSAKNWRWVPSKDNVADDATRDPPNEFSSEHRWFKGKSYSSRRHKETISATNFDVSKRRTDAQKSKLRNMCVELDQDDVMRATGRLDRHQSLDAEKTPLRASSSVNGAEYIDENRRRRNRRTARRAVEGSRTFQLLGDRLLRPDDRHGGTKDGETMGCVDHLPNHACRSSRDSSQSHAVVRHTRTRRFMARRGTPTVMYSDNATNFTKANKELKEAAWKWKSMQRQNE